MTVTPKVWTFPAIAIAKQVFYVPGIAAESGYTSGGVRVMTPEPGGFGVLELQLAMKQNEATSPDFSWLMSKTNGDIFKVKLAKTPQVAADISLTYAAAALIGSNQLVINLTGYGAILKPGHLIGHAGECYIIDEVTYAGLIATMKVKPPLRRAVASGDDAFLRPFFTGQIANGSELVQTFDSELNGWIQPPKMILSEVITP